jgi:hypothetical protein
MLTHDERSKGDKEGKGKEEKEARERVNSARDALDCQAHSIENARHLNPDLRPRHPSRINACYSTTRANMFSIYEDIHFPLGIQTNNLILQQISARVEHVLKPCQEPEKASRPPRHRKAIVASRSPSSLHISGAR